MAVRNAKERKRGWGWGRERDGWKRDGWNRDDELGRGGFEGYEEMSLRYRLGCDSVQQNKDILCIEQLSTISIKPKQIHTRTHTHTLSNRFQNSKLTKEWWGLQTRQAPSKNML